MLEFVFVVLCGGVQFFDTSGNKTFGHFTNVGVTMSSEKINRSVCYAFRASRKIRTAITLCRLKYSFSDLDCFFPSLRIAHIEN